MSDAKAYAQRNQRGSDWFSHDGKSPAATTSPTHKSNSETPETVSATHSPPADAAPDSGRTQMIRPKCDSNQWFKHEKGEDHAAVDHLPAQPISPEASKTTASPTAAKGREGDEYGRRNKAGSSGSWFAHEHPDEAGSSAPSPRAATKEGGENATRMRGESENWFSHDASKGAAPQESHGKGRGTRTQNDEMHHIFHQGK